MLSDVPSAPRFFVDVFSFVVHAEFEVGILQRIFISQTTSLRSKTFLASSSRKLGREQKKKERTVEGEGNEAGNACYAG